MTRFGWQLPSLQQQSSLVPSTTASASRLLSPNPLLSKSAERVTRETGDALRACGFTVGSISKGLTDLTSSLADLLVEHDPVHISEIPQELLSLLLESGLVRQEGQQLVAPRDVRPYTDGINEWFVVSDAGDPSENGQEHVLGVGHASLTLASLIPRIDVERALDLGTGSGIQALHLGTHAREVLGTDVSREALECAAFSAALSGQTWDLRHGSLYEPVVGERFDMIVSNPPFVISPQKQYTYRDAGFESDSFVQKLVRQGSDYLNDGGWLITLANWLHGKDWRERLIEWVAPIGCDVWVVQRETQSADDYVNTWLEDAADRSMAEQWRGSFSADETIGFGWIILHNSGKRSIRLEEIRQGVEHPMGPWVKDRFDALQLMNDEVLSQPLVATSHLLTTDHLHLERGFRRSARLDDLTQELIGRADGRPIGQVIAALADEHGIGVDQESAIDLIQGLIDLGALRLSTE